MYAWAVLQVTSRLQIPAPLTEDWKPPKLLVREPKLTEIKENLDKSRNVYLSGSSGTGKTLTVRTLFERLSEPDLVTLYGRTKTSFYETTRNIFFEKEMPIGMNELQVITQLVNLSNRLIICYDDAFQVLRSGRRATSNLNFLKGIYDYAKRKRDLQIILVATTTLPEFEKICPREVSRRFDFKEIQFPRYNADEIFTILKQRAKLVWKNIDERALRFVAAKSARYPSDGDARLGISILANAWVVYPQEDLTHERITESWHREKIRYWMETFERLGGHAGLFLFLIAKIILTIPSKSTSSKIVQTGTLNSHYEQICRANRIEPLYQQRRTYELERLEREQYINRETRYLGHRGKQSDVTLLFDDTQTQNIVEAGNNIDWHSLLR